MSTTVLVEITVNTDSEDDAARAVNNALDTIVGANGIVGFELVDEES